MSEEIKEVLEQLRVLTDLIVGTEKEKEEELEVEDLRADKVSWTRLYNCDEDAVAKISNTTRRKKSQIIRMLVHAGLQKGIIEEFK